jgi:hypothetical protein
VFRVNEAYQLGEKARSLFAVLLRSLFAVALQDGSLGEQDPLAEGSRGLPDRGG